MNAFTCPLCRTNEATETEVVVARELLLNVLVCADCKERRFAQSPLSVDPDQFVRMVRDLIASRPPRH